MVLEDLQFCFCVRTATVEGPENIELAVRERNMGHDPTKAGILVPIV